MISGELRLADGNDTAGRVEVFLNGEWNTVCDDFFDILGAQVVCRQLGLGEAIAYKKRIFFGEGTGRDV